MKLWAASCIRTSALVALLLVSSCSHEVSSADSSDAVTEGGSTLATLNPLRGTFDEDRARQDAASEVDESEYEELDGSIDCTNDCSGHRAGFDWARENDIEDADYTDGNSDSFNEGVQARATAIQEAVDAKRKAYEAGNDKYAGTDGS